MVVTVWRSHSATTASGETAGGGGRRGGRRRPRREHGPGGRRGRSRRGGGSVVEDVVETRQAVFRRQFFALHLRQGHVVDRENTQFGIENLPVELLVTL